MNDVSKYDKNFRVEKINDDEFEFYPFTEFKLEGFPWYETDQKLYRLPVSIMPKLRESLVALSKSSAGGCIRFKSNSPKIAVKASYEARRCSPGMPQVSDAGFDLYFKADGKWFFEKIFRPEISDESLSMVQDVEASGEITEYMLNFPLYSCPADVQIGVVKGASISADVSARRIKKPILFYGSSITNGGCVSRPGTAYTAVVARTLDAELINMGYSGNAQGEPELAREIAKLDLGLFISEYDHNASVEHLRESHSEFIRIIREAHRDLPILLMTRPYFNFKQQRETEERSSIIRATYERARSSGDKNIYFLNHMETFSMENRYDYSIDNVHPTDLGARTMAEAILKVIAEQKLL